MFVFSFRLKSGKTLLVLAVLVVAVALGVVGVRAVLGDGALPTSGGVQTGKRVAVKTNEQRLAFIKSFGWEVDEEAVEVMEVIIPKEFDEIYEAYNAIQQKQGYDLAKQAGKRCKRYTYVVTNYPGQTEDVRINLLILDGKVIGGDVCSLKENGFLHGFAQPSQPVQPAESAAE